MTTPNEPRHSALPVASGGVDDAFVGRRQELKALGASLDAAAAGNGRLDIVSGPPGIGKTRLALEIATSAAGRGFGVLRGGCWEGEGAPAYWPWAELLRNLLSGLPEDGAAKTATDFSQLLEIAATRAEVPIRGIVDATKDAQQARFMLFDRFCELMAATAAERPLLVIVDDVQSADAGSLLLLQFLAGRLAKLRIALLITSRDPLSEMAASTTRHAWARHRVLRGLSRAEARALLSARVRSPARTVLDRLMHLTDGNPYFLKELGQQLLNGDAAFDATESVVLPASLLVVTLQTYHRLSPECRSLLQAASVLGREFDAELAAHAVGLPIRDALGLLDEAVARRVIAAIGPARYHFIHALVREAIHDQLHPSDRTRFHESIALALERQAQAGDRISAATLAHHFSMGQPLTQRRQAALYSVAAGRAAHAAYAYEEAVLQFRRAHEISGTALTELECSDLLLDLGAAEAGAGEWSSSRRTFEDAATLARRIGCPERLAHAALGFKGMMFGTMPVDLAAIVLLREALGTLDQRSPDLRVRLYSALSRALYFDDDQQAVHRYNLLAIELARPLDDPFLAAELAETRLLAHWQPSGVATLRSSADELLELSVRLHDPIIAFRARTYRYAHLLTVGEAQEAAQELRQASAIASTTHHPRSSWQVALLNAGQALARGKLASARQFASRARELGSRVHDSSPAHHDLVQSFQRARVTKDYPGWLSIATQATYRYPNTVGYLSAHALLNAELKQLDDSRDSLRHFANHGFRNIPANNFQLYTLAVLSEAVVACNEAQWASDLYSLLIPYETLHVVAGWGTAIDGSVAHYLGLLARCMGKDDLCLRHFEMALDANRRLDAPPLLARTQLEFARFLATYEHPESQQRALRLALSSRKVFSELRLEDFCSEADRLATLLSTLGGYSAPVAQQKLPERSSLIRKGDVWTLRFDGKETSLRHRLGLTYLALILQASGEPLHVLDLISKSVGANHHPRSESELGADDRARLAYKDRLMAIESEIEVAERNNDLGPLDRLRQEHDSLLRELTYSYGISGRRRPSRSPAERARISVKNRLTDTLLAIKAHHMTAYQHLDRSIATGAYCRYLPPASTSWHIVVE